MMRSKYIYPLCIQLPFPVPDVEEAEFLAVLEHLQGCGFFGVELNLLDFSEATREKVAAVLDCYNLKLTMVASGAWANKNGFSISSLDEEIRRKSVDGLSEVLEFARFFDAGVICGFLKGGTEGDWGGRTKQLERSLKELEQKGVLETAPLYLEATNHYESLLINTMAEGARLAAGIKSPLYILPDTYHMNIEEQSLYAALVKYRGLYRNLHISDNNRYFPGFGALDFCGILRLLQSFDYQGTITIEGRVRDRLLQDISSSCAYLAEAAKRTGEF